MQAIILAGGLGTRLRPLTYTVPKPMLPVAGRPALAHIVDALVEANCDEVIVTTNYLAEVVAAGILQMDAPIGVRCIREKDPLGTAGCVKNIISELGPEFLVIQGDAVADVEYGKFIDFHHQRSADVSMTVMRVQDTREYGIVGIDNDSSCSLVCSAPAGASSPGNCRATGSISVAFSAISRAISI
jgi:mannose-1-phosphate guanylyltransferase/phosphomannomutase